MKLKISTTTGTYTPTTTCIGSFAKEVTGQFQYHGKKGEVYLFNIAELTETEIVLSNVLTKETVSVSRSDIQKIKTLDGQSIQYEEFTAADTMALTNALMADGQVDGFDINLAPVTIHQMTVVRKELQFADLNGPEPKVYGIGDLMVKTGEGNFGK